MCSMWCQTRLKHHIVHGCARLDMASQFKVYLECSKSCICPHSRSIKKSSQPTPTLTLLLPGLKERFASFESFLPHSHNNYKVPSVALLKCSPFKRIQAWVHTLGCHRTVISSSVIHALKEPKSTITTGLS